MHDNEKIHTLHAELEKTVTPEYLQKASVHIIDRFKAKDLDGLASHASFIGIDTKNASISRIFASLIQIYHPDRIAKIRSDIIAFVENNDLDSLLGLKQKYILAKEKIFGPIRKSREEIAPERSTAYDDYEYEERYAAEETGEEAGPEWFDDEEEIRDEERVFGFERNFTEAVNSHFFGNLEYTVTVGDLQNLDGELDLSDSGIVNLEGIEHCVHLTGLNLSGNEIERISRLAYLDKLKNLYLSENRIESISALAKCVDLEELDLSFNQIRDISVLLTLPRLVYVNMMNNPIAEKSVIEELVKRGVVVVY